MATSVQDCQDAIRSEYGADATLLARERVRETFEGKTLWDLEVLVFELEDHPEAGRCFAWEHDGELKIVLHDGTARAAVFASTPVSKGGGLLVCGGGPRY